VTARTIDRTVSHSPLTAAASDDWIDAWALERAEYQVMLLSRQLGLAADEADDARQELLMDVWAAAGNFDPGKATRRTFICRVLKRSAARVRRKVRQERSNDRAASDPIVLSDLSRKEAARRRKSMELSDASALALDVEAAMRPLRPDRRALAERLMHQSPTHAAEELGKDRSTAYRAVAALRSDLACLRGALAM
jgi:DNA-directed RNA polymerase specialized sigma24 family protein